MTVYHKMLSLFYGALEPVENITIEQMRNRYRIKQSTAYKWRKWLEDNGHQLTWENLEKIDKREFNLSKNAGIIKVEPVTVEEIQPQVIPQNPGEILGMSRQRVEELNAEAELEVLVKDKLRELHEDKIRQSKAQALKSKAEEVKNMDLGKFSSLLSSVIGGAA